MNYYSSANQNKQECPDELLALGNAPADEQAQIDPEQKLSGKDKDIMTQEDLRKYALEILTKKITTGQ